MRAVLGTPLQWDVIKTDCLEQSSTWRVPLRVFCKGRDMLISVEGAPMQWFFIRLVSESQGHFPQPFAVDAFGGASPFPTDSPPDAHCLPGQACPVAFYR